MCHLLNFLLLRQHYSIVPISHISPVFKRRSIHELKERFLSTKGTKGTKFSSMVSFVLFVFFVESSYVAACRLCRRSEAEAPIMPTAVVISADYFD